MIKIKKIREKTSSVVDPKLFFFSGSGNYFSENYRSKLISNEGVKSIIFKQTSELCYFKEVPFKAYVHVVKCFDRVKIH